MISAGYFSTINDDEVADLLNKYSKEISAVRGNCDNERIENLLQFALLDVRHINLNGKVITLTHGHLYDKYHLPEYCGDIFLSGHTHYGMITKQDSKIFANPGSISLPREKSEHSYLIMEQNELILKNVDGKVLKRYELQK